LVGDDHDPQIGVVEPTNRRRHAIEEGKLVGILDVLALVRRLGVDGAVAIQKGDAGMFQDVAQSSLSTSSTIVCPTSICPS
jgi:hypothetical protein